MNNNLDLCLSGGNSSHADYDALDSKVKTFSQDKQKKLVDLNIYNIGLFSDLYSDLIQHRLQKAGKYNISIFNYLDYKKGIENVDGLPNTIVLLGPENYALDSALNHTSPMSANIKDNVKYIKNKSPKAKVIITADTYYSKNEAIDAGADGFLLFPDCINKNKGKQFSDIIDKVLNLYSKG